MNILLSSVYDIYQAIEAAKSVTKLQIGAQTFADYVNTCVAVGTTPYMHKQYDGVDIDEYKVIDAISCLSHFVVRVNTVSAESLYEYDHLGGLVELPVQLHNIVKRDVEYPDGVDEDGKPKTKIVKEAYAPRILTVEEFNRVTMSLKRALRCGETTFTRARQTLTGVADMAHSAGANYFDTGSFEYAPVKIKSPIFDEYEKIEASTFKRHFLLFIQKELNAKAKTKSAVEEQK